MKLKSLSRAYHDPRRGSEPRRTNREMAEEFGISTYQLARMLRVCPCPEADVQVHKSPGRTQVLWYLPTPLRAWWRLQNL